MLKAVVFDLDGLIFNTEDVFIYAIERLLAPFGFQYEEGVRRQMMGQQAHVSIGILKDHYRLKGSNEEIRQQVEKEFLSALPDILQLMPGFDGLIKSNVTGFSPQSALQAPRTMQKNCSINLDIWIPLRLS